MSSNGRRPGSAMVAAGACCIVVFLCGLSTAATQVTAQASTAWVVLVGGAGVALLGLGSRTRQRATLPAASCEPNEDRIPASTPLR
jgi:hypothetical protein